MIEQLPSHSRYKAAVWDDDDAAPTLAKLPTRKAFGLREWTPERAQLTQIIEYLAGIQSRLIAQTSKSGKGPRVRPQARPTTAVDRWERSEVLRQHHDLKSQLLPNRS